VSEEHTAHLVRFCCWSLLSCGLVLFINLCSKIIFVIIIWFNISE
jgi:hypothetical protein